MYGKRRKKLSLKVPLPLIIIGLVGLFLSGSTYLKHNDMQAWETVAATINHVDLETHKTKVSTKKSRGSLSKTTTTETTSKLSVDYSYLYEGRDYSKTEVISGSILNLFERSPRNAYKELLQYERSGEAFQCYVNPDNPDESALYRDFKVELMFIVLIASLVFIISGYVMMRH